MNAAQQPAPTQLFDHVDYPGNFPLPSVMELTRIVKAGTVAEEVQSVAIAGWNVAGWALSMYPGRPPLVLNGHRVATDASKPTEEEIGHLRALCAAVYAASASEPKAVGAAGPVGSDLSVFINNLKNGMDFVKALVQFIRDIFNLDKAS